MNRASVIILSVTCVFTLLMIIVYVDFLNNKLPDKKLLDPDVLIIYHGEDGGTHPITEIDTHDYFYQSYYSINDEDLKRLPPLLYKYHTLIVLHEPSDSEILEHHNIIYLNGTEFCGDWQFVKVYNGIKINCNPEKIIRSDLLLQKFVSDYLDDSWREPTSNTIIKNNVTLEKLK